MYLTYNEYLGYGGTLPESEFILLEFRCRKRIDDLTASRVQGMKEVPEAVKLCMMSLIKVESVSGIEAQAENPTVTSFSTDGYSENYGNALTVENAAANMNSIIKTSLAGEKDDFGVLLLYRGVYI